MLVGLCDLWGPEWLDFEPATVRLEIADTFRIELDDDLFDKLMAARQVVISDQVLVDLPAFVSIINALTDNGVDSPTSAPIDPVDLSVGIGVSFG